MPEFVHLHVHSEYSLLDGLASTDKLARHAKELGMTSLALTDHGVMFGAVDFFKACKKHEIKPIMGSELYVAPGSRFDRNSGKEHKPFHLTALARNETGYRNLLQLVSKAQLEGFYYRPRVDRELLEQHRDGLIVFSGCPSAEIPRLLRDGQRDQARSLAGWFHEVFGKGNFFVEVQNHDIEWLPGLTRELIQISRDFDLPLVATNDVHFSRKEDHYAHDILLCIQTNSTIKDPKRMRYTDSFYMRSPQEMAALFAEIPEAIRNTVLITEQCSFKLDLGTYHLPIFEVPGGFTPHSYLRHLCEAGLTRRYPFATEEIRARLEHELRVINQMGFDTYFLIVWDLCDFARRNGIWWNVRGSAAGSIVAYTLGITNLDPLKNNLIFERFLNPGRVSMPDIDLDFPDDQRDAMINYTVQKYGSDKVAQIITFGTMGARAAVRDAGRALDLPLGEVDRVARLIPAIPGKPVSIANVLDEGHEFHVKEFREIYESSDYIRNLIDTAQHLEGVARHASTHAAGVVVADKPLVEYCPLARATKGDDGGVPVTQFDMGSVEAIGLLKIDFLGLSTLTIMRKAVELIQQYQGVDLDLATIPVEDPGIFKLLSSGDVQGVFQVEGQGMRRVLMEMQPTTFEDIVAILALYRPGPMEYIPTYIARKHGREPVQYRHPKLKPILSETFGICVYQEQIIRIATDLAGYDAGEADMIRKAVGKKNKEALLKHREAFVGGAVERDIPKDTAEGIFDDIEFFARYGFNKAHSADYAVITCQTAYLKAKYPVEYLTAMLSVEMGNTDKVALLIADAQHLGIPVLPPDVNKSQFDFTIESQVPSRKSQVPGPKSQVGSRKSEVFSSPADLGLGTWDLGLGIRFGLGAIKNVGQGPVEAILKTRGDGPFRTLDDFCRRVDLRQVNRRALECLVKAGAFDSFGRRSQVLTVLDAMMSESQHHHHAQDVGQLSLFGGMMEPVWKAEGGLIHLPDVKDLPHKELLAWEKELIGVYLSEHPLHRLSGKIEGSVTALISQIEASMAGQHVFVAGLVTSVRTITTKKGDAMAFVQLEDLGGDIEVVVFPRTYAEKRELWSEDNLLLVKGRVEERDGKCKILAEWAEEYQTEPLAGSEQEGERASGGAGEQGSRGAGGNSNVSASPHPRVPLSQLVHHLHITLPRSVDLEQDIVRLGQLYDLLQGQPGADRFFLYVYQGSRRIQLDFPNTTTRFSIGLQGQIEEMLGSGSVRVERKVEERVAA